MSRRKKKQPVPVSRKQEEYLNIVAIGDENVVFQRVHHKAKGDYWLFIIRTKNGNSHKKINVSKSFGFGHARAEAKRLLREAMGKFIFYYKHDGIIKKTIIQNRSEAIQTWEAFKNKNDYGVSPHKLYDGNQLMQFVA